MGRIYQEVIMMEDYLHKVNGIILALEQHTEADVKRLTECPEAARDIITQAAILNTGRGRDMDAYDIMKREGWEAIRGAQSQTDTLSGFYHANSPCLLCTEDFWDIHPCSNTERKRMIPQVEHDIKNYQELMSRSLFPAEMNVWPHRKQKAEALLRRLRE